jgi:hypothetical protein
MNHRIYILKLEIVCLMVIFLVFGLFYLDRVQASR